MPGSCPWARMRVRRSCLKSMARCCTCEERYGRHEQDGRLRHLARPRGGTGGRWGVIQLTRATQRAAGGCNACNRNIGPEGFIDPLLPVRMLTVGADESRHTTGLRFCAACRDELVVMVLKGSGATRWPA